MTFTTLPIAQMGAVRSDHESIFRIGVFSNVALVRAIAATFVLLLVVIYPLGFQGVMNADSLSTTDMLIAIAASLVVVLVAEVVKWFERRNQKN